MSTSDDLAHAVKLAEGLEHEKVLEICASAVDQLLTVELVRLASNSLLAFVAQGRGSARSRGSYHSLYRFLVLQPTVDSAAPILHYLLSSHHTSGIPDILREVARELDAVLHELWREGCRSRNYLLMLLLLREFLPGWAPPSEISKWHVDALPTFSRAEMELPYNMMFDRRSFRQNIGDVRQQVERSAAASLLDRYRLDQVILFQCMTGSAFLDRQSEDALAWIARRASDGTLPAGQLGSARSLVLRAIASRAKVDGHLVAALDRPDGRFAATLERWQLPSESTAPGAEQASAARARLRSRLWQGVNAVRGVARGPALHLGRRRPRVALCVSGQLRGYRIANATWRRRLLNGVDCTTFVHTWARIGRSGAEPFRSQLPFEGQKFQQAYRHHAVRLGMEEMTARYPSLFATLHRGGNASRSELCQFYETDHVVLEDDDAPEFKGWPNSRKMHYKIAACNRLAATAGEFDLVLRIRPDKQVRLLGFDWGDMLAGTRSEPIVYADHPFGTHYANPMIGDQVALGAVAAMNRYSETAQLVETLGEFEAFGTESRLHQGHVSLAAICWLSGIAVEKLPAKFGGLAEAEPLSIATIAACLERDSSGRDDDVDRDLRMAAAADQRGR